MRSLALTTFVAALFLSASADAAKYKCVFLQDGGSVGEPCEIDSNASNNICQRVYNRTLAGKCFATATNEQLNCVIFNQVTKSKKAADQTAKTDPSNAPQIMSEEPGFVAGAGTWSSKSLTVGYKRNAAGPVLMVTCGAL